MFTVILQDAAAMELARSRRPGNEKYLMRGGKAYRILSQLDLSSYDVFSQSQAVQLHGELLSLLDDLDDPDDRAHIRELARIALRAANTTGATITFTPFQNPEGAGPC